MHNGNEERLLEVKNLKEYFTVRKNDKLHAVDDVSFYLNAGETFGVVGESGCGKSTLGKVIVRLLEPTAGDVLFRGESVVGVKGAKYLEQCKKIQLIFQDPYSSLNPHKTIRQILAEAYQVHGLKDKAALESKINELIKSTGLEEYVLDKYPHELDGGRRQLVGIARALSLEPELIVCDEPVSSLDVSIQATIINLLMEVQKKRNVAYLFISHDISVVKHISHRIAVMYLGQIVELADTETMFERTMHPYSISLLSAVPRVSFESKKARLVLTGDVPSPINPGDGCRFASRCWMADARCKKECPALREVEPGHVVACHYADRSQSEKEKYLQKLAMEEEAQATKTN